MNSWIDISGTITNGMVHWPGDVNVSVEREKSIDDGAEANVTTLSMSAHTCTHIDAPLHFIGNGNDVTQIPLEVLIGRVKLIHVKDSQKITVNEIRKFEIGEGDRIIFRTRNSEENWLMKPFREDYVFLSTDAATYLRDKGVIAIGVDYLSVAGMQNGDVVHKILLEKNILIIEGLILGNISQGEYEMICLPLKIKNSDGAPARVVIREIER
jgi:arylformamidase